MSVLMRLRRTSLTEPAANVPKSTKKVKVMASLRFALPMTGAVCLIKDDIWRAFIAAQMEMSVKGSVGQRLRAPVRSPEPGTWVDLQ